MWSEGKPGFVSIAPTTSGLREEFAALAERVAALEEKSSAAGPDRGGPARQVLVNALDEARRERDQEREAKMRAEEERNELRERLERIGKLTSEVGV
jgi:hypothetical protein